MQSQKDVCVCGGGEGGLALHFPSPKYVSVHRLPKIESKWKLLFQWFAWNNHYASIKQCLQLIDMPTQTEQYRPATPAVPCVGDRFSN